MQKLTFVPSKNVSNLVFYTLITIQAKQEAFMSHISTELDLLIQSLLGNDLNTKFLNILETPEHWNYQYFLALLPLLGDVDRLAILTPEAVAKGSPKDKKEDRPPRLNLLDRKSTRLNSSHVR